MAKHKRKTWEILHTDGFHHQLLGEWGEARRCYEQALILRPGYAFAQLALAQLDMMQSGFREGREGYEARFEARDDTSAMDWRVLPLPRWRGESVQGKHILIWAEQGFGDVIMAAGFLPQLLAQQPARVTLAMFPKMMSLFARAFPQVEVISFNDIGEYSVSTAILELFPELMKMVGASGATMDLEPLRVDYERALKLGNPDYSLPMADLMVYGLPEVIPAQLSAPYLTADAKRMVEINQRLQKLGEGRRVGVSWYTPNRQSGTVRSIALEQWMPILSTPHCHFISLQHDCAPAELRRFQQNYGIPIIMDPVLDDIADAEGLAALTACMDEVITIDNSNAHLAGALGVPTTLLLSKGCDFRWPELEDKNETLWYQSLHLERQDKALDWQPVIARVAQRLRLITLDIPLNG